MNKKRTLIAYLLVSGEKAKLFLISIYVEVAKKIVRALLGRAWPAQIKNIP